MEKTFTFLGVKYQTPLVLNSSTKRIRSSSDNFTSNTITNGAQRFDFQLNFLVEKAEDIAIFNAHANNFEVGSFDFDVPQLVKFPEFGIVMTENDYVGGDNELDVTFSNGFFVGQYLNFKNPGHTKLYQIVEILDADNINDIKLKIYPRLRKDVPMGTTLELNDPVCRVEYANPDGVNSYSVTDGKLSNFVLDFVEKI